jgi:hypothetical protein
MKRLFLVGALLAVMLVPAASASAAPTGEWAKFKDCPLSNPNLFFCIYSVADGGSFKMGAKTVPVKNPVTLQGGVEVIEQGEPKFYGAANGVTLSKTPQPVPGGLTGIVAPTWWPKFIQDWFNGLINEGFTGVNATVELAAPATSIKLNLNNLLFGLNGTAIQLPVKIKLDNAILGSNCYIGSNSKPMVLNFTTGTTAPPPPNTPLKGSPGTFTTNETEDLLISSNNKLVDNSFAAPATSGCGGIFSFLVDPLVSSVIGVPAAAGTNTAILEGDTYSGYAPSVKASEP